MTRFTLTDDGRLVAHGSLGERDLSPAEVERIREALESPRLPAWMDWSVVVLVIAMAAIFLRGGGS